MSMRTSKNLMIKKIAYLFGLLITRVLWDWGLTWVAPFFVLFVDLIDFLLSFMDKLPLSVGGGGSDVGPSRRPLPDLNFPPSLEPEPAPPSPSPEPAPPAPLSAEEEQHLLTKREDVKLALRVLLQIGYGSRGRNSKTAEKILQDMDIDSERDATFLDELYDHLDGLSRKQGGVHGQPQKLPKKGLEELLRWISEKKGN